MLEEYLLISLNLNFVHFNFFNTYNINAMPTTKVIGIFLDSDSRLRLLSQQKTALRRS